MAHESSKRKEKHKTVKITSKWNQSTLIKHWNRKKKGLFFWNEEINPWNFRDLPSKSLLIAEQSSEKKQQGIQLKKKATNWPNLISFSKFEKFLCSIQSIWHIKSYLNLTSELQVKPFGLKKESAFGGNTAFDTVTEIPE